MINAVVGSSVFGLPSTIGGKLGSASPWAWLIAAAGIGVIMACFAEVASRFGASGGPYLYARVAFGRFAGIEMGWLLYLTRITAAATNANLLVIYLAEFWPGAGGVVASRMVLAGLIGGFALINIRGVTNGARTSSLFAAAKLVPLGVFVGLGVIYILTHPDLAPKQVSAPTRVWLDAVLLLVFAYGGFEAALMPLAEAPDPRRDAPFALFTALALVTLIYTLAQLVVVYTLPDPAAAQRPLAASASVFLGAGGARFIAAGAVISVCGYLAGATLNVPRLTAAMAEQGDLPLSLGRLHSRFHTPVLSVVLFSGLTFALAASGSFLQNLTLSAVSRLITYGLVCAAVPTFRRRGDAPAALLTLPGGLVFPVLGILFSLAVALRITQREGIILAVTVALALGNWLWARGRRGEPVPGS